MRHDSRALSVAVGGQVTEEKNPANSVYPKSPAAWYELFSHGFKTMYISDGALLLGIQ